MGQKLQFIILGKLFVYRISILLFALFCVGYSWGKYIRTVTYSTENFKENLDLYFPLRLESFVLPFGENSSWVSINVINRVETTTENAISALSTFKVCDSANLSICGEFQIGNLNSVEERLTVDIRGKFQNTKSLSFIEASVSCKELSVCHSTIQLEIVYSNTSNFYGYPNPFRRSSSTFIRFFFDVLYDADISLVIFDRNRRYIKTLFSGRMPALNTGNTFGTSIFLWDGTNRTGLQVSSGIYLVFLRVRYIKQPSLSYERSFKVVYIHQ